VLPHHGALAPGPRVERGSRVLEARLLPEHPANTKAAGFSPAASVSLLNFPVASYMLPPPRTKTAGRYACGRPRVKVSIDSSTHRDRRGFPNGAIVRCDCLVNAGVITSNAPSDDVRVKLPANTKAAGSSPAASVSLLNFPVASYMLPPLRTKTAGRYACGRPRVKVSIDSSTHQDRRGFPNGVIVRCDCLVKARLTTSTAPLDNFIINIPPDHCSRQDTIGMEKEKLSAVVSLSEGTNLQAKGRTFSPRWSSGYHPSSRVPEPSRRVPPGRGWSRGRRKSRLINAARRGMGTLRPLNRRLGGAGRWRMESSRTADDRPGRVEDGGEFGRTLCCTRHNGGECSALTQSRPAG